MMRECSAEQSVARHILLGPGDFFAMMTSE